MVAPPTPSEFWSAISNPESPFFDPPDFPGLTTAPPPPPHPSKLLYGTILRAGLGVSMVVADMDFETYSEAGYVWDEARNKWAALPGAPQGKKGLFVVGSAVYASHPSTEVLTLSYNLKDGKGTRRWRPGMPAPLDLFLHLVSGKLIEAWNVGFERQIWEHVCVKKYGWPPLPVAQLRCAMAKARAFGLPGALGEAAKVLGLQSQKDTEGKRLIDKFCVPHNPTKKDPRRRIRPEEDPVDAENLYLYCDRDIETEAEASSLIPDLVGDELAYWQADQEINQRGVHIDTEIVDASIRVIEEALGGACAELWRLTGGAVDGPTKVQGLQAWLASRGLVLDGLDEEEVEGALARETLPDDVRRVLEIRRDAAGAAVKKMYALRRRVSPDSRARNLFNYHAARTGRCTGDGPQPTNMPNTGETTRRCEGCHRTYGRKLPACPHCGTDAAFSEDRIEWGEKSCADAVEAVRTGSAAYLDYVYGPGRSLAIISSIIRGMFTAGPGRDLLVGDYSAIEAVGAAMLSGEQWRIEVFRTHGKIYEMSASLVTGTPFEEILEYKKRTGEHHPLRKKVGKVTELALGYAGWIGAMKAFGADEFMTDDEMKKVIVAWRAKSPAIVELWGGQYRGLPWDAPRRHELFGLEGMAIAAVQTPGRWFDVRHGVAFRREGDVLYCRLPSGRLLAYHRPRLTPSTRDKWGQSLTLSYEGWNTNPKNGAKGWVRMETHGGKLLENVDQAACRDLLVHATLQLERNGYPVVLHVYDEIVCEVPKGVGTVEEFSALMASRPAWAEDWPVRVGSDAFREERYRK